MRLRGARVSIGPSKSAALDVEIQGGRIHLLGRQGAGLDLSGHILLPGLINAHDHLEFNLFPLLGRGPYPNANAWARDVYRPDDAPVREHRRVPKDIRLYWGGLKNLVSGATTVCHHNPYHARLFSSRFPVRVVREFGWAHSLDFSPDMRARYRKTPRGWPFVIHAAEATDSSGPREILALEQMGVLGSRAVLVHAVALGRSGWGLVRDRGAAIVTCPGSNLATLGRTLPQSAFRSGVPVALGTDSAITSQRDLLDELRVAHRVWGLSAARLYRMVTEIPASILGLRDGQGAVREGGLADLIALRDQGKSPAETLLAARGIELVVSGGRIRLVSERLAARLPRSLIGKLQPLSVAGRGRLLVDADTPRLYRAATTILGGRLRLAGKAVSV